MRTRRTYRVAIGLSGLSIATILSLAPSVAHAQFSTNDVQTGIEASGSFGYGTLSNGGAFQDPGASPRYGHLFGSFGMQFHVGYRIIPVLGLGLHAGWNYMTTDYAARDTTSGGGATAVGVYARIHALAFMPHRNRTMAGTPDLFLGVGFDFYASANQWTHTVTSTPLGTFTLDTSGWSSGFAFPFQLGFDYWLTDNVAIGALGMIAPWTGPTICAQANGGSINCQTRDRQSEVYFFMGFSVSGRFNLTH